MEHTATGRALAPPRPTGWRRDAAAVAFERGGNAMDAALAAAITLAVVYPHMCGVGGDLFALVHHPAGDVVAVNASGRAPSGADPRRGGGGRRGRHARARPAQRHRARCGDRVGSAPSAGSGAAMARRLHARDRACPRWLPDACVPGGDLVGGAERLSADPGLAAVFFDDGRGRVAKHDLIRQPALGTTLQTIADEGPAAWYGGPLGTRFVTGLPRWGSPSPRTTWAVTRADLGSPLRGRYRDLDVLVHPPTPGFVLLEILAAIGAAAARS